MIFHPTFHVDLNSFIWRRHTFSTLQLRKCQPKYQPLILRYYRIVVCQLIVEQQQSLNNLPVYLTKVDICVQLGVFSMAWHFHQLL